MSNLGPTIHRVMHVCMYACMLFEARSQAMLAYDSKYMKRSTLVPSHFYLSICI